MALCAAGVWAVSPSGTLPIVYIQTQNSQSIDRYNEINATMYITGYGQYASIGSADSTLSLTIRGRGNWTWNGFDKKPYRIKFPVNNGHKLLGMHKSRHWALMAGADDYLGFMKNPLGYSLSEHMGLLYTPHHVPVELVLNGSYEGLYFLTETIRIDDDRVNIREQQDGETHPDSITGGWLVEIDNYYENGNVEFQEHNGATVWVTMHEPEDLSGAQREYITSQLHSLNDAIYGEGNTPLQNIMDITDAAKFYLVQEIMANRESYHGSCYLYKDRDSLAASGARFAAKWHFGPVWDFGNSFDNMSESLIYEEFPFWPQVWVEQLCQHQIFYERVQKLWYQYRKSGHSKVLADIDEFVSTVSSAAKKDEQRWQQSENVCKNGNMTDRKRELLDRLNSRVEWLRSRWGEGDSIPLTEAVQNTPTDSPQPKATIRLQNGEIVIEHNGHRYTLTGEKLE